MSHAPSPDVIERLQTLLSHRSRSASAPLAEGLMLSCSHVDQKIDIPGVLAQIDGLAEAVRARVDRASEPLDKIEVLSTYFTTECGFRGNDEEYYDPKNTYLHEVLKRRVGIPLTLSILFIEISSRVGVEIDAISFPFHFLVSPRDVDDLFIDPFHGTAYLSKEDCREMLDRMSQGKVEFKACYLEPASLSGVMVRAMRNLKLLHVRQREYEEAIACLDVILSCSPKLPSERRDRGLLSAACGKWKRAIEDLTLYLERRPEASDRARIEAELQNAKKRHLEFN